MKTPILFLALVTALLVTFLLFPETLPAQAPGMPLNPSAAPIDGGLTLLATACGAYAIKKLRDRKE